MIWALKGGAHYKKRFVQELQTTKLHSGRNGSNLHIVGEEVGGRTGYGQLRD